MPVPPQRAAAESESEIDEDEDNFEEEKKEEEKNDGTGGTDGIPAVETEAEKIQKLDPKWR